MASSEYAEDLDRGYLINGDDLRVALGGIDGTAPMVPDSREAAAFILGKVARPIDDVRADLARADLSKALARTRLGIEQVEQWRFGPTAMPSRPDELARALLARIAADRAQVQDDDVVDAHICCEHADGPGPFADPEVAAMAALAPVLAAVRALDHNARTRVLEWARCRAHAGLPPF